MVEKFQTQSYYISFERYFNQVFKNQLFQTVSFGEKNCRQKRKEMSYCIFSVTFNYFLKLFYYRFYSKVTLVLFFWFCEAIALKLEYTVLQEWLYSMSFFWNNGRYNVVLPEKINVIHTAFNDKLQYIISGYV